MLGNLFGGLGIREAIELQVSVVGRLDSSVVELRLWRLAAGNFRVQIPHKVTQTQIRNSPLVAGLRTTSKRPGERFCRSHEEKLSRCRPFLPSSLNNAKKLHTHEKHFLWRDPSSTDGVRFP